MTQAQCDQLISEHRRTMDEFNARLDRQRQRMGMVLSDKLAARMRTEDTFDEYSDDGDSEDDSEDEVSWSYLIFCFTLVKLERKKTKNERKKTKQNK